MRRIHHLTFLVSCLLVLDTDASAVVLWCSANRCYTLYDDTKTWEGAKEACEDRAATLVSIPNPQTHDAMQRRLDAADINSIWLGAKLAHNEETGESGETGENNDRRRKRQSGQAGGQGKGQGVGQGNKPKDPKDKDSKPSQFDRDRRDNTATDCGVWEKRETAVSYGTEDCYGNRAGYICYKTAVSDVRCPSDYNPCGQFCLYVSKQKHDWFESREACAGDGADLLPDRGDTAWPLRCLQDDAEDLDLPSDTMFWTKRSTIKWQWLSGNDVVFTEWSNNSPRKPPGECLMLEKAPGNKPNYVWIDVPCDSRRAFICQKANENPATTTTFSSTTTTPSTTSPVTTTTPLTTTPTTTTTSTSTTTTRSDTVSYGESTDKPNKNLGIYIAIPLVCVVVICLVVCFVILLRRVRKKQTEKALLSSMNSYNSTGSLAITANGIRNPAYDAMLDGTIIKGKRPLPIVAQTNEKAYEPLDRTTSFGDDEDPYATLDVSLNISEIMDPVIHKSMGDLTEDTRSEIPEGTVMSDNSLYVGRSDFKAYESIGHSDLKPPSRGNSNRLPIPNVDWDARSDTTYPYDYIPTTPSEPPNSDYIDILPDDEDSPDQNTEGTSPESVEYSKPIPRRDRIDLPDEPSNDKVVQNGHVPVEKTPSVLDMIAKLNTSPLSTRPSDANPGNSNSQTSHNSPPSAKGEVKLQPKDYLKPSSSVPLPSRQRASPQLSLGSKVKK